MSQWKLNWISKERLVEICEKLIKQAKPSEQGLNYKNVVDPFSALFDIAINDMTYETWEKAEIRRQHQKTLQNAIGKFHQMVLGSVKGWVDLGVGQVVDLRNDDLKVFAEIKNKFNTVKASDKKGVYDALAKYRSDPDGKRKDYTGYFVQILVNTSPFNRPFAPTDNTLSGIHKGESKFIREIDGRSFYALATGSPTALDDLYSVLPEVLQDAMNGKFKANQAQSHPLYKDLIERTKF